MSREWESAVTEPSYRLRCLLIAAETDLALFAALRDAESTGRPLGSDDFVAEMERLTGRRLQRRKPGASRTRGQNNWNFGISEIGKVSSYSDVLMKSYIGIMSVTLSAMRRTMLRP